VNARALDAVDLFAGPGGWDVAAKAIGLHIEGVEFDAAACQTRRAAGLPTVEADVLDVDPEQYRGVPGLIASPPCQTFSLAGKGAGRKALDKVIAAIDELSEGRDPWESIEVEDERTRLVLIPLEWALRLEPEWLAWEQVPPVLPVWERCADLLRSRGYSVVTGLLNAEEYGVPQTRKRAILIARRNGAAMLPRVTHTKYRKGKPRQEDGLLPWVSMADALGWTGGSLVGFPRKADQGAEVIIDGTAYRERDLRPDTEPAQAVTEKVRSWQARVIDDREPITSSVTVANHSEVRDGETPPVLVMGSQPGATRRGCDDPAPTVAFGNNAAAVGWHGEREAFTEAGQQQTYKADVADFKPWTEDRPATTVATTVATRDLVPDPGANANRFNGATKSRNDGVRITVREAALLQSFPEDHPWQGTKTKVFQQIGNAIPPLLAGRVILAALGYPAARFKALEAQAPADNDGDSSVSLRNNTSANAAVRPASDPAPTLYFGARMNAVTWEGTFQQPTRDDALFQRPSTEEAS
jgi:DNA (cytosine-5)-methyltransferase 1